MANEVGQQVYVYRIHQSYHVPHHPEAADLIEQWKGLWKTKLQNQLGGNILEDWVKILQEAVYALNWHPTYCAVSPIVMIYWSKNQAVKMGMEPLTITPSDPLAKFYFLSL